MPDVSFSKDGVPGLDGSISLEEYALHLDMMLSEYSGLPLLEPAPDFELAEAGG